SLSRCLHPPPFPLLFLFTYPATTETYTLSLHDALPISNGVCDIDASRGHAVIHAHRSRRPLWRHQTGSVGDMYQNEHDELFASIDRKSTRLNSSHLVISYAVFCLKKKKKKNTKKSQETK